MALLMLIECRLLTEQTYWLSRKTGQLMSTPYGRIADIQYIVTPYSLRDGTASCIIHSNNGQIAEYSYDGVVQHTIDYYKWRCMLSALINEITEAVAAQLPSNTDLLDFMNYNLEDNFSESSPPIQKNNQENIAQDRINFQEAMKSPTDRHHLFNVNGSLNSKNTRQYIEQDQKIRRLLSALFACSSGVTLRAWQFASIVLNQCTDYQRNLWILGNRFVAGKPNPKQHNRTFGGTLMWFPRKMTRPLAILFYLQQPFIATVLLKDQESSGHLYGSHVWPLPSKKSRKVLPMAWNGQEINRAVHDVTKRLLGCPVNPPLIRQLAQGLLRDKCPGLFEIWQHHGSQYLANDTHLNSQCLYNYADKHGLRALISPDFGIPLEIAAACLIIVDIWQCMHKMEAADLIWKPMVEGAYIFPTTAHDSYAYDLAQNLKDETQIKTSETINQSVLMQWLKALEIANTSVRT